MIAEQKIITGNDDRRSRSPSCRDLVLEGYNAIVIDAASPTALTAASRTACDAGIIVVVYDSLATEPCAIKLNVDYHDYGVRDRIHGEEARWEG